MDFGLLYHHLMVTLGRFLPEPVVYYLGLTSLVVAIVVTSILVTWVIRWWWKRSAFGLSTDILLAEGLRKFRRSK
jgi:hypothetical protein